MLDVIGQNYRPKEILAAHAQKPSRKIIGTENAHDRDQWTAVRDHPEYSGMFVWAGTDYLGESRRWPTIADSGGLDDRTDAMKPDGLERQSWWVTTAPVVHVVRRVAAERATSVDPGYEPGSPQALALANGAAAAAQAGSPPPAEARGPRPTVFQDWTPRNLAAHDEAVEVYSNCNEVELSLNGKSLGKQTINADASARKWTVKFEPGALKAACVDHKKEIAAETLRTAGKPAKLMLAVERAKLSTSFDDIAYLRATVVDEQGIVVPDAQTPLTFAVTGPGVVLATDSGDNADHSGFQKPDRIPYLGAAVAVVRATAPSGSLTVSVIGAGLTGASVTLPIGK
jgi:beta-galactosidase